jgi:N utilization substance protein A
MSTLTNEEIQMCALLEQHTGAVAHDVVAREDAVTFIVKAGDAGKAIGKGGAHIKKLSHLFGKPVEVVEDAETVEGFVRNLLAPAGVKSVTGPSENGDRKVVQVEVEPTQKGLAIGKGGERVRKARLLAKRRFDIDDVKIL